MPSGVVNKMLKHKMGGLPKPSEDFLSSNKFSPAKSKRKITAFRPGTKPSSITGKHHDILPLEHDSLHLQTDSIGGPTTKRPGLKQHNRFKGRMHKPAVFPSRKVV